MFFPDCLLFHIFSFLEVTDLIRAARVCKTWHRITTDNFLWKRLLYKDFGIDRLVPLAPGKDLWIQEYKRLKYHTPVQETERLTDFTDEVLHVSFSHDGTMFACCSKDGYVKLYNATYPVTIRYSVDMKPYSWKYPQFSQFNDNDSLLLVSGVFCSVRGQIRIFRIDGEELTPLGRVSVRPYDIFGTWFDNTNYISSWTQWSFDSDAIDSLIGLKNAYQHPEMMGIRIFYRFANVNGSTIRNIKVAVMPVKLLIFETGSTTYIPHQIGFKKILPDDLISTLSTEDYLIRLRRVDKVDHVIDLHGHIIGMALSPDQRYLYVNVRPWPKNYVITDPFHPPEISQEIEIRVIDLVTFKVLTTILKSHKAYTPNDNCFFIFLDVSHDYVASGSEDQHGGYLWDRHYSVVLNRFPHDNVVNCVAINPVDQEMLITASDDYTLKVWRSRNRVNVKKAILEKKNL